MKKNDSMLVMAVIALAVVGGAAYMFGSGRTASIIQGQPGSVVTSTGGGGIQTTGTGVTYQVTSNGVSTLSTAVKSTETPTLQYLPTTLYAVDNAGNVIATATATGGVSLTYATLSVPNGASGTIYALSTGSIAGASVAGKSIAFSANPASTYYQLEGANTSEVYSLGRSTSLVNVSNETGVANCNSIGCRTTNITTATGTGVALGAGDSTSGYIDLQFNASSTSFGTGPTILAFSRGASTAWSANALTLTGDGLSPTVCPADVSASIAGTGQCWVYANALKSNDGFRRLAYTLRADLGNPAPSDSPSLYIGDKVNFLDVDGKVKMAYYNQGAVDQGQTNSRVIFATS